jgi:hypothetical protein
MSFGKAQTIKPILKGRSQRKPRIKLEIAFRLAVAPAPGMDEGALLSSIDSRKLKLRNVLGTHERGPGTISKSRDSHVFLKEQGK